MKPLHVLACVLLLSVVGLAQQAGTTNNPQYGANDQTTYTRPVDTGHHWGGWGLLGLFGLAGLLGRRRSTTTTTSYTDERPYREQQRRVG